MGPRCGPVVNEKFRFLAQWFGPFLFTVFHHFTSPLQASSPNNYMSISEMNDVSVSLLLGYKMSLLMLPWLSLTSTKTKTNGIQKFCLNQSIPVASGVRVDGKDRLRLIVDHLLSPAHNEGLRLKQMDEAWNNSPTSHPWVMVMKKCKTQTLEFLLRMAVDVYNDCRVETLRVQEAGHRDLWPLSRATACYVCLKQMDGMQNLLLSANHPPDIITGTQQHMQK